MAEEETIPMLRADESLPLDRTAAVGAVASLRSFLERLSTDAMHYASVLPDTSEELAAAAIDEWDDGDGEVNFVQALLMRQILDVQLQPQAIHGDVDLKQDETAQVIIRHGSLRVVGALRLHAPLMVLGNLNVGNRVIDMVKASRLIVTDNLACRTLRIGSPFWVAGNVDAEAVCFDPGGKLWVGGDLRADVIIGSQQSAGVTHGNVTATLFSPSREWDESGRTAIAKLEEVLVPDAFRRAIREKGIFQPEDLLELVEAGKSYLRRAS